MYLAPGLASTDYARFTKKEKKLFPFEKFDKIPIQFYYVYKNYTHEISENFTYMSMPRDHLKSSTVETRLSRSTGIDPNLDSEIFR